MTHTRSPLQNLNMRRANTAPMDELHKTLESLEERLKELSAPLKNPADPEHKSTERIKTRMNLADIAASLDKEIAVRSNPATEMPAPSFDEELARIEDSVEILTAQRGDANMDQQSDTDNLRHVRETAEQLQEELEALKRMMQTMAREETVRGLSHRWDQFDEKFEAFESQHSQKTDNDFPELNSISDRLDDVRRAIDAMPQMQAVSIQPLEDRISGLAQSIEQMIGQREDNGLSPVLDERLDEISRAILAANMKRSDSEETRRAEALSQELLTRMAELSQRIDVLSESSSLPIQQIETLAKQIRLIATYIDRALESGPALELEKVNARLDEIARQLSHVENRFSVPEEAIFAALDQRFDALVLRLDEQFSQPADNQNMMQSLEAQIASIAKHLAEPKDHLPLVKNLAPRLEQVESALQQSREDTLDIARKAAEAAMEKFAAQAQHYESGLIKDLANDMHALEELARRNDERNEKSFDTVHATLLKVVERLSALEERHKSVADSEKTHSQPLVSAAKPLLSAVKAPVTVSSDLSEVSALPKTAQIEKPTERPDLNAIMRRVRGEPGLGSTIGSSLVSGQQSDKDQQAELISAARTAAQTAVAAAAAVAAVQDGERINPEDAASAPKQLRKSAFTQLIARQRKPIFLGIGAIMVALAALQAGEIYFNKSLVAPQNALPQLAKAETTVEELIDRDIIVNATEPQKAEAEPVIMPEPVKETPVTAEVETDTVAEAQPQTEEPAEAEEIAAQPELQALPEIAAEAGPNALRQAAADGDAMALFEIGNRYTDGIGMSADLGKAAAFYAASAERGFAPAQYRLGSLNEKGLGLPRNIAEAKKWYLQAAEKGNASAMHNLAVLYATGIDSAPDNSNAIHWFEKAAERDVKDSQYNLGILYAQGMGAKLDLEESYKWFALAAQSGDKDAADKRDQVGKALSAEKLKQAQDTVALWKPKALDEVANSVTIPDSWVDENPVQTATVDMKKAVRNIQLILQKNGYDIGKADGIMGDKTRSAIKKFQTANGEEPTGEINPQLVQLLLDHNK